MLTVLPRVISLQNSTNCEITDPLQSPPGPLELQVLLHYIPLCTKKGRKPRRREGDKCFFICFFLVVTIFFGDRLYRREFHPGQHRV